MKKNLQSSDNQFGKVTIVLLNYNHSNFLEESINSIFNQTRVADKIIIIDDASTDESCSKIHRIISRNFNIEFIKHPENIGCVATLNHGLGLITTEYVTFLGADDQLEINYIKQCLTIMNTFPSAAFCCGASNILDISGKIIGRRPIFFPANTPSYLAPQDVKKKLTKCDNFFLGQTAMYRTESLLSIGGFNSILGSFSDGMAMRHLALEHGFCFLPFTLASWRFLGNNMSVASITRTECLEGLITSSAKYISEQREGIFPDEYANYLERRLRFGSARLKILMSNSIDKQLMLDLAKVLSVNIKSLLIFFILISGAPLKVKKQLLTLYAAMVCTPFSILYLLSLVLKKELRSSLQ